MKHEYGIDVVNNFSTLTASMLASPAVAHKKFECLDILSLLKEKHVVFDVKCTLDRKLVDGRF